MALIDHGFAPGGSRNPATPGTTGQQARVRALIERRPATELSEIPETVHDFIDGMRVDSDTVKPIGSALIGTHADSEGRIFISMFADQEQTVETATKGQTDFEVLAATLDPEHTERSIKLTPIIDGSKNHFVHIKGCNIGKVTKFMTKLKEAFAADHVTAPNHFHGLSWKEDAGVYEYMAYEFKVFRKDHFTTRAALIDAFRSGGFVMFNNAPVPPERWEEWVPKKKFKKNLSKALPFKLGRTAGGRKTLTVNREFRVVVMDKKHAFTVALPGLSPFPAKTDWEKKVFDYVRSLPDFDKNHPFPFYERWGYGTDGAERFLAGLKWKFSRGKKDEENTLFGAGTRVEYSLLVPIVDPTDGHLFFNFYPHTGPMPAKQIREDDPFFFSTV